MTDLPAAIEPPPASVLAPEHLARGDLVTRDHCKYLVVATSVPAHPWRNAPKVRVKPITPGAPLDPNRWYREGRFQWLRHAPALLPFS
jgi:hypothetical protein